MGVAIIDKTALFDPANSLGKIVPVMNGLTAIHFDGKSKGINQKINGSSFTVIGSPVNENNYVTDYTELAHIKTQLPCTAEGTIIVIARLFKNSSSINSTLLGWYENSGSRGVSLINATGGLLLLSCSTVASDGVTKTTRNAQLNLSGFTSDTTPGAGRWAAIAGRWYKNSSGIFTLNLNNLTENTSNQVTAPAGSTLVTDTLSNPMLIGSGYVSTGQGGGSKAMGGSLVYDRSLSDDELQLMYSGYLKGYFSRRGITV
ncbi:TPA: hypothetical protein PCK61_004245 [Klebsiella quasipneumoniae]|nr:hypothetical protein [Klebsiella quasipneumoniae]